MNWLKRKIRDWIMSASYVEETPSIYPVSHGAEIEGLNFTVMVATGGTIVQMRSYDRKTDRSTINTHIISDGEDVAERIGQIVSMEILKS